jgi:acyl carrier protein
MTTEEKVVRILSRVTARPERDVVPSVPLSALGMESLDQIECVLSIEEAFHIEIPTADLWQLRTVQDVIDAVKSAVAQSGTRP